MTLSAALIYQKTKQSELSQVKNLNIWGANLEDVSILSQCKNIETLSLSVNSIASLKHLNGLNNLKELYMRKNQIKDLRQIMFLSKIPTLETVWLSDNPIDKNPQYRLYVIKALSNLKMFDEKPVTDDERKQANSTRFSIPHSLPDDEQDDVKETTLEAKQPKQVEQVVKPAYPTNVAQRPSSAAAKPQPTQQHQPSQLQQPQQPSYQPVYPEHKPQQVQQQQPVAPMQQPQQIQPQMQQQMQPQMMQQPMMYNNGMQMPQVAYQPQMYMQQMQGQYKNGNQDANKRILLAVLNLIDGLDYESLEVVQRQVKALMAASSK